MIVSVHDIVYSQLPHSWEVLVEVFLDVGHGLHAQLHGVDALVGQAGVEETALCT